MGEDATANHTDLNLLADYSGMLSQLEEVEEKFEAWNSDDLNNEEMKYYLDVTTRITSKMLDMAQ